MRRHMSGVAARGLVLAALAAWVPAYAGRAVTNEKDLNGVNKLVRDWAAAVSSGDRDRVLALYGPSPTAMPPDGVALSDKAAIRGWFEALYQRGAVVTHAVAEEIQLDRDRAIARGTFDLDVTPLGRAAVHEDGKWMALMRRDASGSWKIERNIWNSDAPAPGTPALSPLEKIAAPKAPVPKPCAERARSLDETFVTAFEAGDLAILGALHGDDAVRLPPGRPKIEGRDPLAAFFKSYVDRYDRRRLTVTPAGSAYLGHLLVWWGSFGLACTPRDGSEALADKGKYMATAWKGEGCWTYDWVLWNSDNPRRTPGP